MTIKESHKHFAIGVVAAFALMALVRVLVAAQDGALKSDASRGGSGTFYCVNPDNPSETCIEPSGWHSFVYYIFGVSTKSTTTSVNVLPGEYDENGNLIPGNGGTNNNPYSPNP